MVLITIIFKHIDLLPLRFKKDLVIMPVEGAQYSLLSKTEASPSDAV